MLKHHIILKLEQYFKGSTVLSSLLLLPFYTVYTLNLLFSLFAPSFLTEGWGWRVGWGTTQFGFLGFINVRRFLPLNVLSLLSHMYNKKISFYSGIPRRHTAQYSACGRTEQPLSCVIGWWWSHDPTSCTVRSRWLCESKMHVSAGHNFLFK